MVINLPGKANIPEKYQDNPGNTGNLQKELKLKVGAPVVVTTNHPKQIYKEDGIFNGARGYVQSIQVAKDNPDKVEVVWVVFKMESVGKRYRFDHAHLRKSYNPGHELATPILPQRKNFKLKFGNIEYQRTNFALSLAYALTAHKCQGDTLEEVIIDFGVDVEQKIKNYILPGSFYVALTRVKMGDKVFLKSFEKSYIKANQAIEGKVDAMKKFRQYNFKKIYLDENIFENKDDEIKIGYLNINGFMDGNHGAYLNEDHNIKKLDILILAETKLNKSVITDELNTVLSDWKLLRRYDVEDGSKHMGLMLLSGQHSEAYKKIKSVSYTNAKRNNSVQIQALIVRFSFKLNVGFLYCRSTPSNSEIKDICENFKECNVLMGDLNLSHRNKEDYQKVLRLCQPRKILALKEITRPRSNNQLDYILIDETLNDNIFATSYHNFVSDHKSIVFRLGLNGNMLTEETRMKINFDKESHMKSKIEDTLKDKTENFNEAMILEPEDKTENTSRTFNRKFNNPDMATCWLNACLQLILIAMDHSEDKSVFDSELGLELLRLQSIRQNLSLNPSDVKDIIVCTEDTRIASRLSQLIEANQDETIIAEQSEIIEESRFNLGQGQQCVRDFFLCLNENVDHWPDVYSMLAFGLTHSSKCNTCGHENSSETVQIYLEMEVPPDGSDLKAQVENYLNDGLPRLYNCEEGCKELRQKTIRMTVTNIQETEYLTIVLSRGIETMDGYKFLKHRNNVAKDISIR